MKDIAMGKTIIKDLKFIDDIVAEAVGNEESDEESEKISDALKIYNLLMNNLIKL